MGLKCRFWNWVSMPEAVKNICFNIDIKFADGHVGRIRDGNVLILFEWKE